MRYFMTSCAIVVNLYPILTFSWFLDFESDISPNMNYQISSYKLEEIKQRVNVIQSLHQSQEANELDDVKIQEELAYYADFLEKCYKAARIEEIGLKLI